ncbi:MAG: LacI family DNA-binding transcriptional regulator [Pseudomonadales bacterium]|nr:LacI family DNA-binding transcriptional regulator [Pseudomonadales bacterium]
MSEKSSSLSGKATIVDVAELAGVSIKTVSRVVNNEPNVRAKTRDKVMDAITRLNYQPNTAARTLSGKRSYVIGLIYENPHEFSYIGGMLNGALHACEEEGYSLLLRPVTLPDQSIADRVRHFVLQARVDGIVLPPPLGDMEEVTETLADLDIPFAAITPKQPRPGSVNITCDDEQASFELTEYLIKQGHTRIGFIKGHPDHGATELRQAGYRAALKAHGVPVNRSFVRQGYFNFESGKKSAAKLLDLEPRPTVIIASNDDMAAGVMFEARERGLSIPDDLSVVGFDDTPLASHMWPTLTTVRQPISRMADAATRALIHRLRDDADERTVEKDFHCELVIRNSSTSP